MGGRWRIEEIRSERREGGHGSADSGEERGSEVGRSNTDEAGIDRLGLGLGLGLGLVRRKVRE